MTSLFLFTTYSDFLRDTALRVLYRGDCLVADTDPGIAQALSQAKIASLPIRAVGAQSWAERDTAFKALAMPGVALDIPFPETELPMWKVLSLDRFSFWYRGLHARQEYDLVMALEWERAYVPLDFHHPLLYALARHSKREVVGIQSDSLRTREWYDLAHAGLPLSSVLVQSIKDKVLLEGWGVKDATVA